MIDRRYWKLTFKDFNFNHKIEIRKGKVFYIFCILDSKNNMVCGSKFYGDFDECLNAAREKVFEIIK